MQAQIEIYAVNKEVRSASGQTVEEILTKVLSRKDFPKNAALYIVRIGGSSMAFIDADHAERLKAEVEMGAEVLDIGTLKALGTENKRTSNANNRTKQHRTGR